MASSSIPARRPRWFWIPLRVLLVTFLLTLLFFAASLLLGILGTVMVAWLRGVSPNMTGAYRHIAAPVAVAVACVSLVSMAVLEVRHYRHARALAEIERSS
jgi:hypothetical protein